MSDTGYHLAANAELIAFEARLLEVEKVDTVLEADPMSSGLDYLTNQLAELNAHLQRAIALVSESVKLKNKFSILNTMAENNFQMAVDKGLTMDEAIKNLKSAEMRFAALRHNNSELYQKKLQSEIDLGIIDSMLRRATLKKESFESTASCLERQVKLAINGMYLEGKINNGVPRNV